MQRWRSKHAYWYFSEFRLPSRRSTAGRAQNMIERARAARQADLDSLFVGDHHVTHQPYYQKYAHAGPYVS